MSGHHAARRARLALLLTERGLPAALITGAANVRYLTGLVSSNAALLIHAAGGPGDGDGGGGAGGLRATLCTDARYEGTAALVCPDLETVIARPVAPTLVRLAAGRGVRELAFEAHHVTVEAHAGLAGTPSPQRPPDGAVPPAPAVPVPAAPPAPVLVPLGHAVEELRMVKDEHEITLLAEACRITDQAFADVLPSLRPGISEREVAVALERRMVDLGAEAPAFESIVASGPNGAVPHHRPGDRVLRRGDLVTMDFGALYEGYHADMTRTVAIGAVAGWQQEIYDLVAAAQSAGAGAARPGASIREVDDAARAIIAEAGYGERFPHGLGHGVGLEIHEAPLLGPDKTGKLADRIPITAEPGVYLAGRGGVRIEDTLVVRTTGPQVLTTTTKDLLVL